MQEYVHVVKTKAGMHMRPALEIFHLAHNHNCFIEMTCKDKTLHAKMVMDVMRLSAHKGDTIIFRVHGEDQNTVIRELETLCKKML